MEHKDTLMPFNPKLLIRFYKEKVYMYVTEKKQHDMRVVIVAVK